MNTYKIALYPGDGIGVDVTDAAATVLEALARKHGGLALEFSRFDWGTLYYEKHGQVAPADYLDTLKTFDAVYLGAVGWPARLPDNITLKPLITMRQTFDQWACVRPARTYPGVPTPLKTTEPIDLVVVRENSAGEYVDNGGRFRRGQPDEFAVQTALHTRRGVERALRFGFDLARKRRNRLTMVTKSNAQRYGYTLWDEVLEDLKPEYQDVEIDKQHIDAISMNFVRRPEFFDVVVGSNLFGDILTDLSGAITGSLGLNPSANLNPERKAPSLFEPVHGSAPDIAGKGVANPVGAILAAGMMLDWLGESQASVMITQAVERVLEDGVRTPDLGGKHGTEAFTAKVVEAI